ncbi:hypothetical protein N2152v2_008249 [Parachlorella kessleri]
MLKRLFSSKDEDDVVEALSSAGGAEQVLHRQLSGVEEQDAQPRLSRRSAAEGFPLHRAAFEKDLEALKRLLGRLSAEEKLALDPQGNTALHVAVLLGHREAAQVLMDGGIPPDFKNRQRWTAIDEAIALRDAAMAKLLYSWLLADTKRQIKEKKQQLLGVMTEMGDFAMQLRWELGSPLFGLLLRRYAPDDTYTLHKVGTRLRVDGTLMGIDHEAHTLLPTWKRGSFSLLVDASATPVSLLFVDHTAQQWVDLTAERKKKPRDIDKEVRELLEEGASKVKWKTSELSFQQGKTWLGRPATEKVEGWNTQVYECTGKLVAVAHHKPKVKLPDSVSWQGYLETPLPEDETEEIPLDPTAPPPASSKAALTAGSTHSMHPRGDSGVIATGNGSPKAAAQPEQQQQQKQPAPRKVAGKCWMAQDFPINLRQLLPLLDVIGNANKHVGRVAAFMQRFSQDNLFPVKVQVPIVWTVYLLLSFRKFRYLAAGDGELALDSFEVPQGFKQIGLEELKARRIGDSSGPRGLSLGDSIQL